MSNKLIQLISDYSLTTIKDYSALKRGIAIGFIVFLIKFIKESEFGTVNIILLIALGVSFVYINQALFIATKASERTTINDHKIALLSQKFYLYLALFTIIYIAATKLFFGIYLLITGVYSISFSLLLIYFLLFSYCGSLLFVIFNTLHDNKSISNRLTLL